MPCTVDGASVGGRNLPTLLRHFTNQFSEPSFLWSAPPTGSALSTAVTGSARLIQTSAGSWAARGDHIALRGFGTFKIRHRKAQTGRNPRTGDAVEVPARDVPVFQPSRLLRTRVDRVHGRSAKVVRRRS